MNSTIDMAWYNAYRPQRFEDVVGQDLVKKILQSAIERQKIRHAYLFVGSKGVGKTTLARIFANELNDVTTHQEHSIDIIEMDAASNTGIDEIRRIIDSAKTPPLSGKYKIFIIDEVHMLSKPAMSGFLKILEEPPEYIVFLLATTNPEKLLPTILSRITLLKLQNHTIENITTRLRYIAGQEGLTIDDASLVMIAKKADGSQRDAINLLETIASYNLESYGSSDVAQLLGLINEDILDRICSQLLAISAKQNPDWSTITEYLQAQGVDPETLLVQLCDFALAKSFGGDASFNGIIPTLVELQTKRFTLSSTSALLALLHAYIDPNPNVQLSAINPGSDTNTNSSNLIEADETTLITEVINDKPLPEPMQGSDDGDSGAIETSENTATPLDSVSQKAVDASQDEKDTRRSLSQNSATSVSLEAASKSIKTLLNSKSCQPMLKMMAGDIEVARVSGNVVELSVTTPIFETQLKTKAMSNYISKHLSDDFQTEMMIEIVARAKSITPPSTSTEHISDPQHEPQAYYGDLGPFEENGIDQNNDTSNDFVEDYDSKAEQVKKEDIKAGDVFYSVFNKLPEELEAGIMPVFEGEIPTPAPSLVAATDGEDDWDKHSESMFEFE